MLPPGDLRMALAALCGDDEWGETWAERAPAPLRRHRRDARPRRRQPADRQPLGAARRPRRGARLGRPAARRPRPGAADGADPAATSRPRSAGSTPTTPSALTHGPRPGGRGDRRTAPSSRSRCSRRTCGPARRPSTAVRDADLVVLGPGSWFTSVLPAPDGPVTAPRRSTETDAHLVVVLNLAPQDGETEGFAAADHLRGAARPRARPAARHRARRHLRCRRPGRARGPGRPSAAPGCVVADVARDDGTPRHDPAKLAAAYAEILRRSS